MSNSSWLRASYSLGRIRCVRFVYKLVTLTAKWENRLGLEARKALQRSGGGESNYFALYRVMMWSNASFFHMLLMWLLKCEPKSTGSDDGSL